MDQENAGSDGPMKEPTKLRPTAVDGEKGCHAADEDVSASVDVVCWSFPAHLAFVCLENISLHFDETADQRDLKDSVTFLSGSPAMCGLCMSAGLMFLG